MKLKKWGILLGVFILTIGLLAACGGSNDTNSKPAGGDLVATGKEVVNKSCVACHGADLKGASAPSLVGLDLSKEEIAEITKNGKGSMPPGLAKGKENAVAEYLITLK